jgi:hypothetical protein
VPRAEKRTKSSPSKRLIVDASVLRAASPDDSTHPTGSKCRDILETILRSGHEAAVTDEMVEEWNRHNSKSARRWRSRMSARRKMIKVKPTDCSDVMTALRQSHQFSEAEVAAVEKDMHLVAAARAFDRSLALANRAILSMDEIVRNLLRKLAAETRAIDRLHWANPATEYEPLRAWLVNGKPAAPEWRLIAQTSANPFSRRS